MPSGIRKNKAPKDANAPKKNLSAYFIFTNERRVELRQQYPDKKLTELTKIMAPEWKAMDPERKAAYQRQSDAQKSEYQRLLTEYMTTENYRVHQAKLAAWKAEQKSTAEKKASTKPKDKNAPKKPQTAYFLFMNSIRPQTKENNPTLKNTELTTLMGSKWVALSEEEKRPYKAQAAQLKEQHEVIVAEYKQSELYKAHQRAVQIWEQEQQRKKMEARMAKNSASNSPRNGLGVERPKVSLPRKPKDKNHPKKPMTAYLLFSNSARDQARAENPNLKMNQIPGVLAGKWKALSEDVKQRWVEEAKQKRAAYQTVIEEYRKSESYQIFQQELAAWKEECDKRQKAADAKYAQQVARAREQSRHGHRGHQSQHGRYSRGQPLRKKTVDRHGRRGRYSDSDSDSDSDSYSDYSSSSISSSSSFSSSSSYSD